MGRIEKQADEIRTRYTALLPYREGGIWYAPSLSDRLSEPYLVLARRTLDGTFERYCNCPAGSNGKRCTHVELVTWLTDGQPSPGEPVAVEMEAQDRWNEYERAGVAS